jgi:hypothetical protein
MNVAGLSIARSRPTRLVPARSAELSPSKLQVEFQENDAAIHSTFKVEKHAKARHCQLTPGKRITQ